MLNDFFKSCVWKVLAYNVKSTAFWCRAIDILGFYPRGAAKMALATVRLWLELNNSSSGCFIFCTFENADYEIHKDLMPSVYFLALKYHLTNIYMKENALRKIYMKNTDCIVNVKSVEIINKLRQSSPGLQIYQQKLSTWCSYLIHLMYN